jgi:hypothetical protein
MHIEGHVQYLFINQFNMSPQFRNINVSSPEIF